MKREFFGKFIYKLILIIMLLVSSSVKADETIVVGQIINNGDRRPIQNVNIFFKNTTIGSQSDEDGYFMIRTSGNESTLVFSAVGFEQVEVKVKSGQNVGINVKMQEKNTLLQEVFIVPGTNPAIDLIKKIRLLKNVNDISRMSGYVAQSSEQDLVLLSKINRRSLSKRIFEQLKKGDISTSDSSLVIPIYMTESKCQLTVNHKKQISQNAFSSPEFGPKILEKLMGEMDNKLNFYENSVTVFDHCMISPLSGIGSAYYNYFLADSMVNTKGKQYEIHFRTKNSKNLAFNGHLCVDSATLSLTYIEAELPAQANINFIHNLRITQKYSQQSNRQWACDTEEMTLNMTYELLADSLHPKPEIFMKHRTVYNYNDSVFSKPSGFAQSNYTQESLNNKLDELNNTPLLRTAKWLADVILTGYVPFGIIDIGKIQEIARLSDIEGLRLNFPFRTNERLWKNISLGGTAGYCFKSDVIKYSGIADFKLPGAKKRIFGLNYTNDYRRIDYNYNDFSYRENPLVSGDEDIVGTLLSLSSADKMNERKELTTSISNDWNEDIESHLYFRYIHQRGNEVLPLQQKGVNVSTLNQQMITITTRFSFNEKTYEDHLQRIYVQNHNPVIYGIIEAGKYEFGTASGNYAKITGLIKQNLIFDMGRFEYVAEATSLFGNVPYPLLRIPMGNDGGCSFNSFNMMRYMEYAADKYISLLSELTLNGLIMNNIPLVKNLNIRELFAFKIAYGSLSESQKQVSDYPDFLRPLSKPYAEVGAGLTNIFKFLTVQSLWRLTDLHHASVIPWGIYGAVRFSF